MDRMYADSSRLLTAQEEKVAREVFQRTLPYSAIRVIPRAGLGNRPYTSNNVGLDDRGPTYHLNVGQNMYGGMTKSQLWRWTMIHELTHVWQSCHDEWPAAFIFKSLGCQIVGGMSAYQYTDGQPWDSYNVEQQASIVSDWYDRGQKETSVLYRYIRDEIRTVKTFP